MSLQDIYYLTNIIFNGLLIVLLLVIVVALFFIMKKIGEISDNVNERLLEMRRITTNPGEVASEVGAAVASSALRGVTDFIKKKASKKGD